MLAINLAVALHQQGENTLLIDANLENPHVGVSLGTGMHLHTIHDVLAHRIAPTQAIHYHDSGLKVVPGDVRPKNLSLDVEKLQSYNKLADVVLFDCPPNNYGHVWHAADQALIITQPQFPALTDANRILREAQLNNKVLVGVVLNKKGMYDLTAAQVEEYLGLPVIAELPHDEKINYSLSRRTPYITSYPNKELSKNIRNLAARIMNKPF